MEPVADAPGALARFGRQRASSLSCVAASTLPSPRSADARQSGEEQRIGLVGADAGQFRPVAVQELETAAAAPRRVDRDAGRPERGVATTDVRVVPDSGTGELAGLRGAGSYAADAMEYTLTLDYDF
jgi:hypothetical protein